MRTIPESGDLTPLTKQGVFLLNTALTVVPGKSNSHQKQWSWFTDKIIQYIAINCDNVSFVLWGRNAIDKQSMIKSCHSRGTKIVCSSHPSPLSVGKTCGIYPQFKECDFAKDLGIDWNVLC